MDEPLDCLIVGGGPAGLTAAVYLGRFRRRVRVVDEGRSRASWIPRTRNLSGFPDGIEGPDLLERMREQARRYGAALAAGRVERVERTADGFLAFVDGTELPARTVIVATGVVEHEPALPHCSDAIRRGLIRICPICDAYETIGKRVAVLGEGEHAAREALFLRAYTAEVTVMLVQGDARLPDAVRVELRRAGIELVETSMEHVRLQDAHVVLTAGSAPRRFDTVYSAFGTTPQTGLAQALGAELGDDGRLMVDAHQQTRVPGLYAAGDLVRSLNQISVAEGEAAIAATAIHNGLPHRWA